MSVGLTSRQPRKRPAKTRSGSRTAAGKENFHQTMRGFLDLVRRRYPEELVTIAQPVEPKFDIAATVFELQARGLFPVLQFEHIRGFEHPVVTNLAANRALLAAALDVTPDRLPTAYRERCQNYRDVELAADAPWQDLVLEGEEVDLTKLPIPIQFPVDCAPYITAGQICARDPDTGVDTTGFPRPKL